MENRVYINVFDVTEQMYQETVRRATFKRGVAVRYIVAGLCIIIGIYLFASTDSRLMLAFSGVYFFLALLYALSPFYVKRNAKLEYLRASSSMDWKPKRTVVFSDVIEITASTGVSRYSYAIIDEIFESEHYYVFLEKSIKGYYLAKKGCFVQGDETQFLNDMRSRIRQAKSEVQQDKSKQWTNKGLEKQLRNAEDFKEEDAQ
ncbi:hypothetical protein LJC55_02405 [Eubacteriales bacterium OttesenSCG-928-N14]|nr:hypothetical protein [Eubacteriales bacterium OttesenSCG-928-N14]